MIIAGKIYMVLYMAGHIAGVVPVANNATAACQEAALSMKSKWAAQLATGYDAEGVKFTPERIAFISTWDVKCEQHSTKPEIYEGPFNPPSYWTLIKEWFRA